MRSSENWPVGTQLPSISRTITLEMLRVYAAASGDHNPIHIDPKFASKTSFKRPIAHGMLQLAFIMEILTSAFGQAWIRSGKLKVRFRKPAYVDGTVTAWGTVQRENTETGTLQITVGCRDERGEDLVTGTAELTLSQ